MKRGVAIVDSAFSSPGVYAATSSFPGRSKILEITGTKGTYVVDRSAGIR